MTFQKVTTYRSGRAIVGALEGDVDMANVETTGAQLLGAVPADVEGLVIDLSAVRYIDSAGIHMLFDLTRRLAASRQRLALAVPEGSPVRGLLKITNVNEAAVIAGSVDQAAGALLDSPGY